MEFARDVDEMQELKRREGKKLNMGDLENAVKRFDGISTSFT
jgi:hypothetical protein